MTEDDFLKAKADGKFIETARYLNHWYGTPLEPLKRAMNKGKTILLDIDIQGGGSIKQAMPEAVTIFLVPPNLRILEKRLKGRKTEDLSSIKKRLSIAIEELSVWPKYDYLVVNDDLKQAVTDVHRIVCAERLRTSRLADKRYWKKTLTKLLGLNGNRR